MSCVREASPPLQDDHLRHDIKKRRFLQPLRGLRRIFRRKGRPVISTASDGHVDTVSGLRSKEHYDACEQTVEATNLEPAKSHSTSQLTDDQIDNSQRRSLQSTLLSVSHDSVFTSEQRSPDSGSETSLCVHPRLGFPHSSVRAELFEAVRRRRAQENNTSDDEDLGLPRSPVSNSPTTADDMFTKENIVTKSSQSTCSDGSLLSMGSSEIDEESYYQNSRNSSKLSLYEKRTSTGSDFQHNDRSTNSLDGDASSLSHSAAKHKMAVKPKRNHGAPHKKRQLITSNTLPTTPEVNEENSVRSVAPKEKSVADTRHSDEHQNNQNYVYKTRHPEPRTSVTQINGCDRDGPAVGQSKRVSLSPTHSFKLLTRNKSNTVSQPNAHDYDDVAPDEKEASGKREDGGGGGGASFFSRLLLRRSSKKKKVVVEEAESVAKDDHEDDHVSVQNWNVMTADEHVSLSHVKEESPPSMAYVNGGLNNAMKHHPMFRQRVEPLNLPTPENFSRTKISYSSTVPVNMNDDDHDHDHDVTVVDAGKRCLQKSHSFRNSEKLPYTCYEDMTPSLPVNIGLAGSEASATTKLSSRISKSEEGSDNKVDDRHAGAYEPVNFGSEGSKWKPAAKVPEYSNISSVNGAVSNNTLSISVNDQDESISTPSSDGSVDAKTKAAQTPDVKVPVPAPRTSLLNKSPSTTRLSDKEEKAERNETELNVTITEIADGQKSIISIGGGRVSVTSDVDDSVFPEAAVAADSSSVVASSSVDVSKADDDCLDDVFVPVCESTRTEATVECVERDETTTSDERRAPHAEPSPQTETAPKAEEHKIDEPVPAETAEPVKPAALYVKSDDPKPDKIRSVSVADKRDLDVPLKSLVVVPDFNAGTVRVNDAVVIMRKKSTREVSHVKDDEEPELMKVFARRSLKLKEPDSVEELLQDAVKSRDSDKENEDANSPPEERKKKEDVVAEQPPSKSPFAKFQRSVSHDVVVLAANVHEKRQRAKSIPNDDVQKCDEPPRQVEAKIEAPVVQEKPTTPFKRIQQRREEWEKRAQQAMKIQSAK